MGINLARRLSRALLGLILWCMITFSCLHSVNANDVDTLFEEFLAEEKAAAGLFFPSPDQLLSARDQVKYEKFLIECSDWLRAYTFLLVANKIYDKSGVERLATEKQYRDFQWIGLPRYYPGVRLCELEQRLEAANDALGPGDAGRRLTQLHDLQIDYLSPTADRKSALIGMIKLALLDYAPAMLRVVELSIEGEALRLTPKAAAWLLGRAEAVGSTDPRIETLRRQIEPTLRDRDWIWVDRYVAEGEWPRHVRFVQD